MNTRALSVWTMAFVITPFIAIAQVKPDSIPKRSLERINPYHAIRTSVYVAKSFGDYVNSGTEFGFEARKFTGLRHFMFASASYGEYYGHEAYRTSSPTLYNLAFRTVNLRVGRVVGKDLYNFYVGSRYIFDASLAETFYSFSLGKQVSVDGNVTRYIHRIAPYAGFCIKYQFLRIFMAELNMEYGLVETFKPLKDNWRAPANESPFFYRKRPSLLRMYAIALHVKL